MGKSPRALGVNHEPETPDPDGGDPVRRRAPRELDAQLQNDDPQNAAELEQLLVGYDLAADDLKNAYEQALGQYSGLPPYDRLIEDRCPDGPWAGRRWPPLQRAQRNDRWSSAGTATPSPATPQCAATSATPRTYGASSSGCAAPTSASIVPSWPGLATARQNPWVRWRTNGGGATPTPAPPPERALRRGNGSAAGRSSAGRHGAGWRFAEAEFLGDPVDRHVAALQQLLGAGEAQLVEQLLVAGALLLQVPAQAARRTVQAPRQFLQARRVLQALGEDRPDLVQPGAARGQVDVLPPALFQHLPVGHRVGQRQRALQPFGGEAVALRSRSKCNSQAKPRRRPAPSPRRRHSRRPLPARAAAGRAGRRR